MNSKGSCSRDGASAYVDMKLSEFTTEALVRP